MSKPAKKEVSATEFTINFLMGGVSAAVSKVRDLLGDLAPSLPRRKATFLTPGPSLTRSDYVSIDHRCPHRACQA